MSLFDLLAQAGGPGPQADVRHLVDVEEVDE